MKETTQPRIPPLRPYQSEAGRAVLDSVYGRHGRSITIEMARQAGKNELSAQLELLLLLQNSARDADAVKCAPTFRPQLAVSMRRLWSRIDAAGLRRVARWDANSIRLGGARQLFLSANTAASVVGHTAALLLEVDEAQDVDAETFDRAFRPMAATTNATTVYYGTPWDDCTLLERAKQANLEAERRDGIRRHFAYDWQAVAEHNPQYAAFVWVERQRLGETHPLFLTQYCLKPVPGAGRFLTPLHQAQLQGTHDRQRTSERAAVYVAGLDLAGGDDEALPALRDRDATVLTIGRLRHSSAAAMIDEPAIHIVEHCVWTGVPHERLLPQLHDILAIWPVQALAVDATGLGETVARLLAQRASHCDVQPVKFSAESKSRIGYELLAAINGGRLKMYRGDGSPEYREFWRQAEQARVAYRANRTMNFYVDPADGHDDYLISAALLVSAARGRTRRVATGRIPA